MCSSDLVLRSGWHRDPLRVVLDYRDAVPHLEIALGDRLVVDGPWHWRCAADGRPLALRGPWTLSCWESDRKATFLEIVAPLGGGLQFDRQVVLLPRDNVLFGLADSGAHVSQLCDACFSTDLLGNWVRDKGVMPLERAIHKLTAEPAAVFGFADRGTLAPGMRADVVVFDPQTVAPGPLRRLRDFPADGERLTADAPSGLSHTLVNGVPIRLDGAPVADAISSRPGRLLRSGR